MASIDIVFDSQVVEDGMPAKPDSRCPEDMYTVMRCCWVKVHELKNVVLIDSLHSVTQKKEL